jgi:DnaJ family protein C protein 28
MDAETPAASGASDGDAPAARKPRRQAWRSYVEERIQAALERGEFDNLRGTGRPLDLDVNTLAGDRALAYSVLKANGAPPREIELGREVDAELARAEALLAALRRRSDGLRGRRVGPFPAERRAYDAARTRTEALYADALRAANRKVLTVNVIAPSALHRRLVDVEARLAAFRAEFPPLPA